MRCNLRMHPGPRAHNYLQAYSLNVALASDLVLYWSEANELGKVNEWVQHRPSVSHGQVQTRETKCFRLKDLMA